MIVRGRRNWLDTVEHHGIDMSHQNRRLGKKERGRRENSARRGGIIEKMTEFRKVHMRKGTNKVSRMGMVPGRVQGAEALFMVPAPREVLRRQSASTAGKKPPESLSLFFEVNNLEIDHELACAATVLWAQAVRTTQWERSHV